MSWWSDRDFRPSATKKVEKILDIIAEIAKAEYERGKEDEKKWWSGFCAKCTDADRPQGEWIDIGGYEVCENCHEVKRFPHWNFCPNCGCRMKGADDE